MRVAALGRTHFLLDAIRMCQKGGHEVVLIGTAPAAPEYRVGEAEFREMADELNIAFFCNASINRNEYLRMARDSGADVAISVNVPTIIGKPMLDAFPMGVVNMHAGDLPRFRGNAAPNWAILLGEQRVVVTLHRMTESLDAGPILLQRSVELHDTTYIGDVYRFLSENVPPMFLEVLNGLMAGTLASRPQPEAVERSLRTLPRRPSDGEMHWQQSALQLSRLVRASAEPFAGAYSFVDGDKITVWRAHHEPLPYPIAGTCGQVAERRPTSGNVAILAGDGLLVLEEVELAASGRVRATAAISSSRSRLGLDVGQQISELRSDVAELTRLLRTRRDGQS